MRVAEFIEWLKTQDQGAIVEVIYHTRGTGYYDQGGNATAESFDPENSGHWYYTDFRGCQFVKEDAPHFDKRFLCLGGLDE